MTDIQLLTLALAVIVPLSMLLLSNTRITDTRTALEGKMNDLRDMLRAEMSFQHTEVMGRLTTLESFLREAVMGKLDDLDRRFTDLERKQR